MPHSRALLDLDLKQTAALCELLSQITEEVYRHRKDLEDFESMLEFDRDEERALLEELDARRAPEPC